MSSRDTSSQKTQEVLARFAEQIQPCTATLGGGEIAELDLANSRVTMDFESTEAHCHSGSVVQGGFVAGMLDSAMSMAVIAHTDFGAGPASLELKVSYLKATTKGVNRAIGWVVQAGKTVAFVEGELYNAAGDLLARASSTARLVPHTHG